MKKRKPIVTWLIITVIVTIVACSMSVLTDTSLGKVTVKSGVVLNECGDTVKYKAYIPKTATADNPAPVIMYAHGGSDGISVQSSYCIEMSRRGYVVVAWDASGAVESEISASDNSGATAIYNMINSWDFVDRDNMITAGHSAGANLAMSIAQNHPDQVLLQINIGYDMYGNAELGYDFNFALIVSEWDDSCIARTTNSGTINDVFQAQKLKDIFGLTEDETLVVDQRYGDWTAKTGRMVVTEHCAHMYYPIDRETQTDFINLVDSVYAMPNYIAATNQVWQFEHIASALLYLCLASYIFLIVTALFKSAYFRKMELPELPLVGFRKKSWQWWIALAVLIVLPVATFRFMVTSGLYTKFTWFITLKSKEYGLWMGWSIITATAYLIFFLIYHFVYGKKHNGSMRNYGFSTDSVSNGFHFGYVLKALLFAVIVMGSAYVIFLAMKAVTNSNIHIIAFSINPIEKHRWFIYLMFFFCQIPYYVFGSLAARSVNMNNGDRNNVRGMIGSVALGGLIGVVGLLVLRGVLMACLYTLHRDVFFVDMYWLLGSNGITTMFLSFLVANALNCYLTNRTNSIYAGVLTAMMWTTWLMVACQRAVAYFL